MRDADSLKQSIIEKYSAQEVTLVNSFMLAVHHTILTATTAGDDILVCSELLKETENAFRYLFSDMGIKTSFLRNESMDEISHAGSPKKTLIFLAVNENSDYNIKSIAQTAHFNKIPLIVKINGDDNFKLNPLKDGADIIIKDLSSCTKDKIPAAFVAEAEKIDWKTMNIPILKVPDPCFNNVLWAYEAAAEMNVPAFSNRLQSVLCKTYGSELCDHISSLIKLP
ncbi:MAG: PLP-dependent transferase [Treponema sp.]|nr:PLP-dependent transferase [Treponema sp.]